MERRLPIRPAKTRWLPLCFLCLTPSAQANDASSLATGLRIVTPEELFAPVGAPKSSTAANVEREQALNYFNSLQVDDFTVSGFVASRKPQSEENADYRTYLGVGYKRTLGETLAVSGRTFYGSGTYSGDNSYVDPQTGVLPDEVRAVGDTQGDWVGTDMTVASKLFARHDFNAGVEYRQQLTTDLFREEKLFGGAAAVAEPVQRKVDVVAKTEVALARGLALNTRLRYDEKPAAQAATIDPRVELRYQPASDATISAVYDRADHAAVAYDRASPLVNVAQDFNRTRNYSLAYEQSLSSVGKVRVSAFRYGVNGMLADAAPSNPNAFDAMAQIDSAGFEVGMERRASGGARSSLSYAYQQTNNSIGGLDQGSVGRHLTKMSVGFPFWARKLSTALEVQYHDIVSPMMGQGYDFVVGNLTLANGELAKDTNLSFGLHDVIKARDEVVSNQLMPFIPQDGRSLRLDLKRKF